MKRTHRKPKAKKSDKKEFRINEAITADPVRFIDEENKINEIISLQQALERANEAGLDLVEVFPKADPPVVKILDYGKLQYQREKMLRKQKALQKKVDVKCIRLSPRISSHDFEVRLNNARRFFSKGARIKLEMILKGREHQHFDKAKDLLLKFIDELSQEFVVQVEQEPKKLGNKIQAIIFSKGEK